MNLIWKRTPASQLFVTGKPATGKHLELWKLSFYLSHNTSHEFPTLLHGQAALIYFTAVSRKVVLQTEKSLRDNVESYYR